MKNQHVERLRYLAKQWHKHKRIHYGRRGVQVRYIFDEEQKLTWWTDTAFVLNNYRVAVSFIHPRMAFEDAIDEAAHANVAHLYKRTDFLSKKAPISQSVGRSRKKVSGYSYENDDCNNEWINALKAEQIQLAKTSDFSIVASIKVEWTKYSRFVTFCAPIEIKNEDDLLSMAILLKKCLKRETTLELAFPGYVYTREDWLREQLSCSNV